MRKTLGVAALAAVLCVAPESHEASAQECLDAPEYRDPLARDGISVLRCAAEGGGADVLIATDESISWPIFPTDNGSVSGEQPLLDAVGEIADGTPYFDPASDRIVRVGPRRVAISLSWSDPLTFERRRSWVLFDAGTGEVLNTDTELELVRP